MGCNESRLRRIFQSVFRDIASALVALFFDLFGLFKKACHTLGTVASSRLGNPALLPSQTHPVFTDCLYDVIINL